MTEERAREISQKVMKEKRQVHDLSSDNEILDDENLHKGISKDVADFLKLYDENSEEAFKEFKAMIDEAEELFKDIIEPSEEDIQWALKALEKKDLNVVKCYY
ncbi:hypothetical protein [Campylobacter cuniculorum]|uniref:Uncharacterized protein n=2 Tax=Campylobacter cuniculorum TaxID=374106 RepID=A0A1W6BW94_9BACT|nr:hypothetical protein [Campylobacter cuniculorum]ARJ56327.1 hypothetical protein CCUN_0707 [Campylobacter cuniculorum DSM 23162 = LMG 24588]QOR03818.1 hypothetical protein A0071_06450 [Campylobacter cuniculorum]